MFKGMLRSCSLVFVLILCNSIGIFSQNFEPEVFRSSSGFELSYQVLYPEEYDASKAYPVVLFLHGAGERGNDNKAQLKHGVSRFLTDETPSQDPYIVVAPQCPKNSYWASVSVDRSTSPVGLDFDYSRPMTQALASSIELVISWIRENKANKKRIYIAGLSMGGMGTFEAVYKFPKLFAAAIPVCGGGDLSAFSKEMTKVPFWVFHGDEDGVVAVENSRKAVDMLKQLGADVHYTEYKGVNHNSWDKAFEEKELLTWLFSHAK